MELLILDDANLNTDIMELLILDIMELLILNDADLNTAYLIYSYNGTAHNISCISAEIHIMELLITYLVYQHIFI